MRYRPINAVDTTEIKQYHGGGNILVAEVRKPYLEEERPDTIWIEIGHSLTQGYDVRAVELDGDGALALRDWLDVHVEELIATTPRRYGKIRREREV